MNSEEKFTRISIFGIPCLIIFILLFYSCANAPYDQSSDGERKIVTLKNWFMLSEAEGNSKQNITRIDDAMASKNWIKVRSLNYAFKKAKEQSIWIRTKLPDWKGTDPALYISKVEYFIQFFLNDSLIYKLGTVTSENFFLGRHQNLIPLHFFKEGDELTIHVWTGKGSDATNRNVILGSSFYLIKDIFLYDIKNLIFAILFFSSGVVLFVFMFILKERKLLFGLALFMGSLGTFAFCNSSFVQLVLKAPYLYFHLGYISLIGSSIGGFYIVEQIVANNYKSIVGICWKLHFLYMIFCTVYILTTHERFLDIIDYYLILDVISIIISLIFLLKSVKESQYEIKIIMFGIGAIFLATFIEVILYLLYGFESRYGYNQRALDYGVTLFVISVIWAATDNYIRTNRQKAELQKAELEAIKNENKVRRNFAARVIESQENERNRIALGLHDSLGQKLLLIKNQLLSKMNNPEEYKSSQSLKSISSLVGESIDEIREIIYGLRPKYLDQLGLKTAVESILEKVSESTKINFHVHIDDISNIFSKTEEINFFRIVQECVNNIVKHSKATDAFIDITRDTDSVIMKISDNGIGFDATRSTVNNRFGITGIRERARIMNAKLDINSHPSAGTSIQLEYRINQK